MKNQSSDRLEIFLSLALRRRAAKENFAADFFLPSADSEDRLTDELTDERFSALKAHFTESEAAEFSRLLEKYQNKTEAEKADWSGRVLSRIGTDEQLIDETVHWSHINAVLQKEIPAVQKIIAESFTGERKKNFAVPESETNQKEAVKKSASPLEKKVRRTFAKQFVSLRDLPKPTWFDRLNGMQLARLIRLAGIRETALACLQIEAVESVAAFLRRFSAEDARAIAAQLNGLRETSETRLAFAENLVQTTLEIEPQPSAMLDLSGIWLVGVLLCNSAERRVNYTNQKLPLEIVSKLPEIIDEECRSTQKDLQQKITAEIERIAETIVRAAGDERRG